MQYDYDLFVIGAGSGGVRASRIAASLGAKVACAEDTFMGGTCVNVGCVPKKLFVYASEFPQHFSAAEGYGWHWPSAPKFDWHTLKENKDREIGRLNGIYDSILSRAEVETFHARAQLLDKHTVRVGEREVTAKNIIIATGGTPKAPEFPGAEHCLVSDDIFALQDLPGDVLVQGGGYIAVEFAGILRGLGCNTELLYRRDLFLRGFDKEVREFVAEQMTEKGVKLSFNSDITAVEKLPSGRLKVTLNDDSVREVDAVLSAIGRVPRIQGLGLEKAAVETGRDGFIAVDENFRTSTDNIYAVGDVVGRMPLTPVALAEGMALARFIVKGDPIELDYSLIPTAVFCQPTIGTVGITEEEARETFGNIRVYTSNFRELKNTLTDLNERTFMKLIVDDATDKVVGCHLVGPEAAEILQGFAVAMVAGARKADFDRTLGIHPTAAEELVTMREVTRR